MSDDTRTNEELLNDFGNAACQFWTSKISTEVALLAKRQTAYAAALARMSSPSHDRAMAEGGWQELGDWRPKAWVRIDLWIQCYDLADRDSDRLVPTVGKRVPSAVWFDGQWCNGDGNPHEDLEGFEDARITHWRAEPAPPVFPVPPLTTTQEGETP